MTSVSNEYEGDSMFSNSPKGAVDVDATTLGLIITKDPITVDTDQQSNSQRYSYYLTNSAVNTYSLANATPQCHCTTAKYAILLATIPGFVLISAVITMVIKVLLRKGQKRRRSGTLRRTSKRPIVRDLDTLQMSCVVNEGNVFFVFFLFLQIIHTFVLYRGEYTIYNIHLCKEDKKRRLPKHIKFISIEKN